MKNITSAKKKTLNRLKRIEGQSRGIHKMVENNENLDSILIQLSAMKSALSSVEDALYNSAWEKIDFMIQENINIEIIKEESLFVSKCLKKRI